MRSDIQDTQRSASYSIRQAASILGTSPSDISRAIRVGTLRAGVRRGRLVVPASALVRLLGPPVESAGSSAERSGGAR